MSTVINGPILILEAATALVGITTGSSAEISDVDYSLANVQDRIHPLRTFRTEDPTSSRVMMNVPSGTVLSGCFIDNVNFDGSVNFNTFNNVGAGQLSVTPNSDGSTIVKDPFTGRRKAFVRFETPVTFNGGSVDKIRVISAGGAVLAPGSVYTGGFEWGAVTYFEDGKEIGLPGGKINDIVYSLFDPQISTKFPGGATENVEIGEKFISIDIPNRDYLESSQQSLFDIFLNRSIPIIYFENNGNLGRAYTTKADLDKATKVTYKVTGEVFSVSITLTETT